MVLISSSGLRLREGVDRRGRGGRRQGGGQRRAGVAEVHDDPMLGRGSQGVLGDLNESERLDDLTNCYFHCPAIKLLPDGSEEGRR